MDCLHLANIDQQMRPQLYLPSGKYWDISLSLLNAWKRLGYFPNILKPKTYNEFYLQQKFNFGGDLNLARRITDKVEFKKWLIDNGFHDNVINTIRVFVRFTDVQKYAFPRRCVIKPTHSSGDVIVISDHGDLAPSRIDLKRIESWFKDNYYLRGREPNYKGLVPRVVVEELLVDEAGRPPSDYKIHCVEGVPFLIQVDLDRFRSHTRQLYTPEWELLPFSVMYRRHLSEIPRPPQLPQAMEIARQISRLFKLCRVDFYFFGDNEIRVGEVTFFPGNGAEIFDPPNSDREVGKLINSIMLRNKTMLAVKT